MQTLDDDAVRELEQRYQLKLAEDEEWCLIWDNTKNEAHPTLDSAGEETISTASENESTKQFRISPVSGKDPAVIERDLTTGHLTRGDHENSATTWNEVPLDDEDASVEDYDLITDLEAVQRNSMKRVKDTAIGKLTSFRKYLLGNETLPLARTSSIDTPTVRKETSSEPTIPERCQETQRNLASLPCIQLKDKDETILNRVHKDPDETIPKKLHLDPDETIPKKLPEDPDETIPKKLHLDPDETIPKKLPEDPDETIPKKLHEDPDETIPKKLPEDPDETIPKKLHEDPDETIPKRYKDLEETYPKRVCENKDGIFVNLHADTKETFTKSLDKDKSKNSLNVEVKRVNCTPENEPQIHQPCQQTASIFENGGSINLNLIVPDMRSAQTTELLESVGSMLNSLPYDSQPQALDYISN